VDEGLNGVLYRLEVVLNGLEDRCEYVRVKEHHAIKIQLWT
jgi:hypothetical protein